MAVLTMHIAPDGRVRVADWEREIELTPALLGDARREVVTAAVHIHATNGDAEYEVTGWDAQRQVLTCQLVQVTV